MEPLSRPAGAGVESKPAAEAPDEAAARLIAEGQNFEDAQRLQEALQRFDAAVGLAPALASAHRNRGNALCALGDPDKGIEAYAAALRLEPGHAGTHCNMGNAYLRCGRYQDALSAYRKALDLEPGLAEALAGSGAAFALLRDWTSAIDRYRDALARKPQLVPAQLGLAHAHVEFAATQAQNGRLEDAIAHYAQALEITPDAAHIHSNLGNAFASLKRTDEALASFRRALELDPHLAEAHYNLGNAHKDRGLLDEAIACYESAVVCKPDLAEGYCNLGAALEASGRYPDAIANFRRALAIRRDFYQAHFGLANSLNATGASLQAIASYQDALSVRPDAADALTNLGTALQGLGRLEEAETAHRRVQELDPDNAEAHNNLGNLSKEIGDFDGALASYRRALALKPDFATAYSNLLLTMNYSGRYQIADSVAEARRFGKEMTLPRPMPDYPARRRQRSAPLRVGMVSGDLRSHPVGYFLEGLVSRLDASRIELVAFPTSMQHDATTERLRPHFSEWISLAASSDHDGAEAVRAAGVQVLLDLSGHTARNRLPMFALRPAPVQVTWLGYFATTGVSQIDYILGDPYVTPDADAWQFVERIWRLPESYLCFSPPLEAPEVAPLPAADAGHLTFGSFNNLTKMNDEVVALWARVLQRVPEARLFLKSKQLNDAKARDDTLRRFFAAGIAVERLTLEGDSPRAEYLAAYGRVDIALDPFPFPGGTTSAEGLWMGVPVLTRRGDRFVSHMGESIAHNSRQSAWIAADDDDYVAKAAGFAADVPRLSALRARLREQVRASPLFDAARFARQFEDAMWGMWDSGQTESERRT